MGENKLQETNAISLHTLNVFRTKILTDKGMLYALLPLSFRN